MKTSRKFLIGIVIVIIAVGGFFGYRAWQNQKPKEQTLTVHPADFLQQVSVSGTVTPTQSLNLSFEQTGRLSSVPVHVGDHVKIGTVLASEDTSDLQAELANAKAGIAVAQAKLNQVLAGASSEDVSVSETAVANAQISVENAQDALANARQSVFDTLQDALTKSDDAVFNKADQLFSNPQTQNAQVNFSIIDATLKNSLETERLAIGPMLQDWNTSLMNITDTTDSAAAIALAKKNLLQTKTFLDNISLAVNNPNNCVYTAQQTCTPILTAWKTDNSTARTNISVATDAVTGSENAFTSAQSNVKSAEGALQSAKDQLALKQAPASTVDVSVYQAEVEQATAGLQTIQAALDRKQVRSPINGVVTVVNAKVGAIVSPNDIAVSLISADTLQIESYVPEKSIPFIQIGNNADVTLDAYGSDVTFATSVVSVDPAETVRDGVSTYRIVLQFVKPDDRIKSGMTANILIATEKKSNVIAVPQGIVTGTDGHKTVRVKDGDTIVERSVETGSISSLGQIEITSGLNDGDVVVLTPAN